MVRSVTSKLDNPLKGRRVINIAEGTFSDSTRFEFVIEPVPKKKRKKEKKDTRKKMNMLAL